MKYTQKYIAIILVVVFVGGIFYAKQNGYWQTETSKTPEKMIVEGQEVYNPEDIRGSYSFEDVSKAFDVPVDVLIDAFQLPEGTDGSVFKNKDLEELYGELAGDNGELGNGSVKIFVAFYKNIPMELEEGNLILERGAEILKSLGTLTDEQMEYLDRNTISLDKNELGIVPPVEETSSETQLAQSIYNDGKYTGIGTGYRSGLEVEVEIKNGEIYNIEVIKEREDEEFYLDTFDIMETEIIDNQSTSEVQGITGATCTADGFKEAVENALEKARK
jgi:uncharacterized protein with FMN-binding domain